MVFSGIDGKSGKARKIHTSHTTATGDEPAANGAIMQSIATNVRMTLKETC